jgi:hypothetical protein
MPTITARALRTALIIPLLATSALLASTGHAHATINPSDVDRPMISAGDLDFGNKNIWGTLSGGIVNWDMTPGAPGACQVATPWISGRLYVNNQKDKSSRILVDFHDADHHNLHTWHSGSVTPSDNGSYYAVISDTDFWGSSDLDHIVLRLQVLQNDGSWTEVGEASATRPRC